ncbi:cytochrome P450 [Dichomitus squalens LYAD-421 SS1]|uniref:Cytochrome P450 n=1 Tax=Dichomitus squalens (strain LYAD-421) TaxID=732165 RepID=R7SPW2_DICSQ|nr:cytochrome P450 [Dichomitus squalens LYAD-421 SS1]EJF57983.1 cytochrome P450 [Dichomitus squalens LYAD-421 SS1]
MANLAVFVVVCSIAYMIWRFTRNFFVGTTPLDNIPGPAPASLLLGNMQRFFTHDNDAFLNHLIETYGPVSKLTAALGIKTLHVYDLKALHSIHVKDQDNYWRGKITNETGDLTIGPGLLSAYGEKHKKQRKILNPAFSTPHMRELTPLFFDIVGKNRSRETGQGWSEGYRDTWLDEARFHGARWTGILGYSFDPLVSDSEDAYAKAFKDLIPATTEARNWAVIIPFLGYLGPAWFRRRVLDVLPIKSVQRVKNYGPLIPYDELSQLPYLDAVCRETLRLYPTAYLSVREARMDTVLPFSEPVCGVDGTLLYEILVPKGTILWSYIRACNTNKALWGEDALEWKPERWLQPLPQAVEDARVPGTYSNL